MASPMHSSTTEMVERKVLEMAQHASFHQHVSYNLSTILHAFTAGKADPTEIAEAFSRARGLEVITRVVSGEPLAKPPVVSLCSQVGRHVFDKFGAGVSLSQAGGLVEAVVARLTRGISGEDAAAVECQVESARLLSAVAGQEATLLIGNGALGAVEGMLERLGRNHSSIFPPCCEALERVSQAEEGLAALEKRGTGGVLLATIRGFPQGLEEGSDAALEAAMKVVERIFTGKSPQACALSLRASSEDGVDDKTHLPSCSDNARCMETLLAVVEATPEAPGSAAATCLWWLSGASSKAPDRALSVILAEVELVAADGSGLCTGASREDRPEDLWAWIACGEGGDEKEEVKEGAPKARPVEAARFLAALCLCKPGEKCVEEVARKDSLQGVVNALVTLCRSPEPFLAGACCRIVYRLAKGGVGKQAFVDAAALVAAVGAGKRFEVNEDADTVGDAEASAIAASLGVVATLAEASGRDALAVVDDAFRLSVRCLGRVGEFSGRAAAAAAKSALDVITVRLTWSNRWHATVAADNNAAAADGAEADDGSGSDAEHSGASGTSEADESANDDNDKKGDEEGGVDAPMEVLKDATAILAVMKAHSTDARVQQAGWRSLIAMDTGRGDVEKFWTGAGDRRKMLKDCLERHGGDSVVAGQVADILEGLVLQGDSDEDGTSLTASLSDTHGEESPLTPRGREPVGDERSDAATERGTAVRGGSSPEHARGEECFPRDGGDDDLEQAEEARESPPSEACTSAAADGEVERVGSDGARGAATEGESDDASGGGGCTAESVEGGVVAGAEGGDGNATAGGGGPSVSEVEGGDTSPSRQPSGSDGGGGNDDDDDGGGGGEEEPRDGELSTRDVLLELSLTGTKALEGTTTSSSDAGSTDGNDGEAETAGTGGEGPDSTKKKSIARTLFGDGDSEGQGERAGGMGAEGKLVDEGRDVVDASSGAGTTKTSQDELELQRSWATLAALHSDILGRSLILAGESAEMVGAIPEPGGLKERVETLLQEYESKGGAREAFAAASLALVGALTAATGALANSQKEVQRYLDMSRDLRDTSAWNDISEAMQWTMGSLKGTVIIFTPHASNGLAKAVTLCKDMDSAFKLFKEAALQIKIVVVELAGEHEPNTVWRLDLPTFSSLPENRKLMVLKQIRSLVVAYDYLSEEMRRGLTTALEIIKNREILNMMGKCCIQAEIAEEKRREAKLATAEERFKSGARRASGTRQSVSVASGRKTPPISARGFSATEPSPLSRISPSTSPRLFSQVATPPARSNSGIDAPSSGSSNNGSERRLPRQASDGSSSGRGVPIGTPRTGQSTKTTRGVASSSRRRDTALAPAAASPAGEGRRSKSLVRRQGAQSKSPAPTRTGARSKSPVPTRGGARSKSPTAARASGRSKSTVPTRAGGWSKSPVPTRAGGRSKSPVPTRAGGRSKSPVPKGGPRWSSRSRAPGQKKTDS